MKSSKNDSTSGTQTSIIVWNYFYFQYLQSTAESTLSKILPFKYDSNSTSDNHVAKAFFCPNINALQRILEDITPPNKCPIENHIRPCIHRMFLCGVCPCSLVTCHTETSGPLFCLVAVSTKQNQGSFSVWRVTKEQAHTPQRTSYGYRA